MWGMWCGESRARLWSRGRQGDLPGATRTSDLDNERGQSLAELAIALMLMLYLIIGVLDLGRALHAYTVLVQATREAVMLAASTPTGLLEAPTVFQDELARGGVNGGTGTISLQIELLGSPPLPTVVADASYTLPLLLPLAPVDSVTVSAHSAAVMLVEE